jgi:hypothetical protein
VAKASRGVFDHDDGRKKVGWILCTSSFDLVCRCRVTSSYLMIDILSYMGGDPQEESRKTVKNALLCRISAPSLSMLSAFGYRLKQVIEMTKRENNQTQGKTPNFCSVQVRSCLTSCFRPSFFHLFFSSSLATMSLSPPSLQFFRSSLGFNTILVLHLGLALLVIGKLVCWRWLVTVIVGLPCIRFCLESLLPYICSLTSKCWTPRLRLSDW